MVVVDYSISERYCRNKYQQNMERRRQQILNEDVATNVALLNFCPRLRPAITLLSHHKVGPLKLPVHLSDFQSSTTSPLPTDGLNSNTQVPRTDRFVLALPYFGEDISVASSYINMVRWSIITQCGRPDKAPEIILLGMDDSSIDLMHGDASLNRQRRFQQTHQIIQERYWQQYVASDLFNLQCLSKWNKMNNNNAPTLQYCLLADQLYECYAQFQFYKLKTSLKSTLSPSLPQLIEAYTQYKQLMKLSKSNMVEMDAVVIDTSVELLVELEDNLIAKEYDDRRKQRISTALVRMRVIISITPNELTAAPEAALTEAAHTTETNKVQHLASVNTTFPPPASSGTNNMANMPANNLNKKYVVKIINPKFDNTTHQYDMMATMLDTTSEPILDTTMIDFVSYVRRVQHFIVKLYNCEIETDNEKKIVSDDSNDNSIQLLLDSLYTTFCGLPSNGNYLLDYQINNHCNTIEKTISFIRFLLVDGDVFSENTQLKYILTIEYNNEVSKECKSSTDEENVDQTIIKKLVPIVALRSVYDDENYENYLKIDIASIINNTDTNHEIHEDLATAIKTATVNGMRQLRHKVLTPVLTRYNKLWSPSDPYFMSSLQKPQSYPS